MCVCMSAYMHEHVPTCVPPTLTHHCVHVEVRRQLQELAKSLRATTTLPEMGVFLGPLCSPETECFYSLKGSFIINYG